LYEVDFQGSGFEWIDFHDAENSVISFIRRAKDREDYLIFLCNFTPTPHLSYRVGMPEPVFYREVFNSDSRDFGGSNLGNGGFVQADESPSHGRPASASVVLPPLGVVVLKPDRNS